MGSEKKTIKKVVKKVAVTPVARKAEAPAVSVNTETTTSSEENYTMVFMDMKAEFDTNQIKVRIMGEREDKTVCIKSTHYFTSVSSVLTFMRHRSIMKQKRQTENFDTLLFAINKMDAIQKSLLVAAEKFQAKWDSLKPAPEGPKKVEEAPASKIRKVKKS